MPLQKAWQHGLDGLMPQLILPSQKCSSKTYLPLIISKIFLSFFTNHLHWHLCLFPTIVWIIFYQLSNTSWVCFLSVLTLPEWEPLWSFESILTTRVNRRLRLVSSRYVNTKKSPEYLYRVNKHFTITSVYVLKQLIYHFSLLCAINISTSMPFFTKLTKL